jgi:alpha-tubulin suppressor-like RCC1 family protein
MKQLLIIFCIAFLCGSCKKDKDASGGSNTQIQIAAGDNHSLLLKADHTLWATGYNVYGQLGDGTTTNRNAPVKIMENVKAIAAGDAHSLILKTDNTIWAAGLNSYGQLGDGTNTNRNVFIKMYLQ